MHTNPEVVSIWSWIRWTVFPFVSLKRHAEEMDAYGRIVDQSEAVNDYLAEQLAEQLDYVDSLEMQLADRGIEPNTSARHIPDQGSTTDADYERMVADWEGEGGHHGEKD